MTMDEHIDCDRQLSEAEDKIKQLEAQLEEEFSRGVKEGLEQAAEIVKNC